jgi:hypothetical protein
MAELKKTGNSPLGELRYVIIDGEGQPKLSDETQKQYKANLVLPKAEAEKFIEEINLLGEELEDTEFKPFVYLRVDDEGEYQPTKKTKARDKKSKLSGNVQFSFKTNAKMPNGEQQKIPVFNSMGKKIALTGKIGNGSTGIIAYTASVYETDAGNKGISLYLRGIQLKKFIEYTGVAFEAMEGAEEEMEGTPEKDADIDL